MTSVLLCRGAWTPTPCVACCVQPSPTGSAKRSFFFGSRARHGSGSTVGLPQRAEPLSRAPAHRGSVGRVGTASDTRSRLDENGRAWTLRPSGGPVRASSQAPSPAWRRPLCGAGRRRGFPPLSPTQRHTANTLCWKSDRSHSRCTPVAPQRPRKRRPAWPARYRRLRTGAGQSRWPAQLSQGAVGSTADVHRFSLLLRRLLRPLQSPLSLLTSPIQPTNRGTEQPSGGPKQERASGGSTPRSGSSRAGRRRSCGALRQTST